MSIGIPSFRHANSLHDLVQPLSAGPAGAGQPLHPFDGADDRIDLRLPLGQQGLLPGQPLEEVVGARPQVTGDLLQGEPQELERQYLLQRDEVLVGVQAVPGPGVGGAQEPLWS